MLNKLSKGSMSKKLITVFSTIVIMFIGITIYINYALYSTRSLYNYNLNFVIERSEIVFDIQQDFTEMRHVTEVSFFNENFLQSATSIETLYYQNIVESLHNRIIYLINGYITSLHNDSILAYEKIEERLLYINRILLFLENIHTSLSENYFIQSENNSNGINLQTYMQEIENDLLNLRLLATILREETNATIDNHLQMTNMVIIVILFLIIISVISISLYTIKSFQNMIQTFRVKALQIVEGDFRDFNDENNEISNMLKHISETFSNLIEHIKYITQESLKNESEVSCIDSNKFNGLYKDLADSINVLIDTTIIEKNDSDFKQIIVDSMPLVSGMWTENLQLIDTNEEALRRYGFRTKKEYLDRFNEISPKYQPCGALSSEKAIIKIRETFEKGFTKFEWLHQDIYKEIIPSEITMFTATYRNEIVVLSYSADLRELKKIEEKEKKVKNHMEFMLESTPLHIQHWNKNYEIIYANTTTLDFWKVQGEYDFIKNRVNYLPENQENGFLSLHFWEDNLKKTFENLNNSIENKWEFTYKDKNGEKIYFDVQAHKVNYEGSDIVITYSKDITEIKKSAENTFLEKQKTEVAQENSQAKSMFLAKMSHEIRTPLSAILGISELQLLNTNYDVEIEEAFLKIHSSASSLLEIVNDILDLSKIEAGKMSIMNKNYHIASFIQDTAQVNTVYLGSKDIDFKVQVNPKIPLFLVGDELRIKQILNNILSNAFKYTDMGYVRLNIDFDRDGVQNDFINLSILIEDTGKGMDEEQVRSLFDEYSRFREQDDEFVQGTGLGMSIVKNFLSIMNGEIKVDSRPHIGTKVYIKIPQKMHGTELLGQEEARNLENFKLNTLRIAQKLDTKIKSMPHGKVLVVDDVEANLYVARGLISRYDIKVETVTSGIEAIAKIKSGKVYDIIFMDQMMPELNGTEATKIIRSYNYTNPIIAFTANALVGKAKEFLENGFDGFISKPIQSSHLESILYKFIGNKQVLNEDLEIIEDNKKNSSTVEDMSDEEILKEFGELLEDDENEEEYETSYLNDPYLIKEIQNEIVEKYTNSYEEIAVAINNNDFNFARRTAHTLKGLAAMLKETKLKDIAEHIETSLESDIIPSKVIIEDFGVELKKILDKISNS